MERANPNTLRGGLFVFIIVWNDDQGWSFDRRSIIGVFDTTNGLPIGGPAQACDIFVLACVVYSFVFCVFVCDVCESLF